MASGKLPPRQKMISMMYLVLLAMLALNMSKKVLSSFGYMNEKIEETNKISGNILTSTLAALKIKSDEQPKKYKVLYRKAVQVKEVSDDFYHHLSSIKETLLESIDPDKIKDYEVMDTEESGNTYLFVGDGLTKKGQEFLQKIKDYPKKIKTILGENSVPYKNVKSLLLSRFDTSDQITNDGLKQSWIKNRFEGFPLIATLANLSSIQTDIRNTQKEIYGYLLGSQLQTDAAVTASTYQAIVISDKPAYFEGEQFSGKVVLGRYDPTLLPEQLIINGMRIKQSKRGAAVLKFRVRNIGENPIKGRFIFSQDGKKVTIPVKSSYLVVAKPDRAVVSAEKMNVVYRGIENPILISMPGVNDNSMKATAVGLRKVQGIGRYVLTPSRGNKVVIDVEGTTSEGSKIRSRSVFRIKDIPAPVASVRGQFGSIQLPKSSLQKVSVNAKLVDFDFDLNIKVVSFKIKVPGQATVLVKGSRMNDKAKRSLRKVKRGDIVNIFDVKGSVVGNSSYKLKKIMPLSIEINN